MCVQDLEKTVEILLPRAGDTNRFIQQETRYALQRVATHLSPNRVIPTFIRIGASYASYAAFTSATNLSLCPPRGAFYE